MQAATEATTQPKGADTSTHQRGALDRDLFCPRLQRLLLGAASELGQRGNLAQVVASIERGGVGGAGEDPNLGMLRRLGATDTRGIDNRVGQLRELEARFHALERKHQGIALAHYPGTPRAHHTLRSIFGEGQGGLAGVVYYRWQLRQAKARARDAGAGGAKVDAALVAVRAELGPLEREMIDCAALLNAPTLLPAQGPCPPPPDLPLVLARTALQQAWRQHRRELLAWSAPVREARAASAAARANAETRLYDLDDQIRPLQAEQARLCALQAEQAAIGCTADDEQALVDLCRNKLTETTRGELLSGAETDVRALHRAWYATAKKAAKVWADEGAPA